MPDKVNKEKQDALRAFGSELIVTPTVAHDAPNHYVNVSITLEKSTPNSFRIN